MNELCDRFSCAVFGIDLSTCWNLSRDLTFRDRHVWLDGCQRTHVAHVIYLNWPIGINLRVSATFFEAGTEQTNLTAYPHTIPIRGWIQTTAAEPSSKIESFPMSLPAAIETACDLASRTKDLEIYEVLGTPTQMYTWRQSVIV